MNSRNIILSGILIALVMLVTTNVFFTSSALATSVPGNVNVTAGIGIWEVKKDINICDNGASTPQGPNYEIGGCVDVTGERDSTTGNETYIRSGSYLFTGETLNYLAVARDLSGAQFLAPMANFQIDSINKVLCTQVPSANALMLAEGPLSGQQGLYPHGPNYNATAFWYGHDVSGLLAILPARIGINDPTGFSSQYDALYSCTYTVTSADSDLAGKVTVLTSDTQTGTQVATVEETWAFNPFISASVHFDTGSALQFPTAQSNTTVYSTNSLLISNTALGGVNLAVFLTGNDLTANSGSALCPTSNVLSVTNIGYRCNVGSFFSEIYQPLQHMKQAEDCGPRYCVDTQSKESSDPNADPSYTHCVNQCLVDPKVTHLGNNLIPDAGAQGSDSILGNGEQAQCTFQLNVPFPCVGTYSATNAVDVLIRAV